MGGQPAALAVGADAVWVVAEESGTLVRIDPGSGDPVGSTPVGNGPVAVAVGLGAVWTANRQDGTVSRIDPARVRVTNTLPSGRARQQLGRGGVRDQASAPDDEQMVRGVLQLGHEVAGEQHRAALPGQATQ